jgi:hypothetical protein
LSRAVLALIGPRPRHLNFARFIFPYIPSSTLTTIIN